MDIDKNRHSHTIKKDGRKLTWFTDSLWESSKELDIFDYDISDFDFDVDCWFGDRFKPTIQKILEHTQKINKSSLKYPIILSSDGIVMDGLHRICKAHLNGQDTIRAVQFHDMPEPDLLEEV